MSGISSFLFVPLLIAVVGSFMQYWGCYFVPAFFMITSTPYVQYKLTECNKIYVTEKERFDNEEET